MFDIKKRKDAFLILGTGSGWERVPKTTDKTIYCLNDYILVEKYGVIPDVLFIMDVLDEKPQIVSGVNSLQDVVNRINKLQVPLVSPFGIIEVNDKKEVINDVLRGPGKFFP